MDNIEKLQRMKEQSEKGGGDEKIDIQHNLSKLTARERILKLFDEGSFIEVGTLVGGNGGGVVTGYGTIEGRLVYVFSQDYTVDGGSMTTEHSKKICRIMDMALKMGAPIVQIFDSAGAKLSDGLETLGAYGNIIKKNAQLSGVVPQIAVVAGACTGAAAISAAMSDFTIMVEKIGELYINPPEKISEKDANYVSLDMYGDALSGSKNGTAQLTAENDSEALQLVRNLLSFLPSNNLEVTPSFASEELSIPEIRLDEISKEKKYDIYEIINLICDKDSLIEINGNFHKEVLTGLTRLNGVAVGVMAMDKIESSERLDRKAIGKLIRFVKLCNCFNIPIISLVDTKGLKVNLEEEKNGLALTLSRFVYALSEARVPKVSLIIGEAYGSNYLAFASKEVSFDITYAWPSAKVSAGEPESIIKTLHREEILSADNPKEKEKEVLEKYRTEITNPYAAAEKGYIDDIILPSESRIRLFAVLDMLQSKRELSYPKKHGSVLV